MIHIQQLKHRLQYNCRGDEKMIVSGQTHILEIDIADNCQKGFNSWIRKHMLYAKREASDAKYIQKFNYQYDLTFDNMTHKKKVKYYKMPLFIRPLIYFIYRFVWQKGYMDGAKGILYHFLHAFVYRELVDFYIFKNKLIYLYNCWKN